MSTPPISPSKAFGRSFLPVSMFWCRSWHRFCGDGGSKAGLDTVVLCMERLNHVLITIKHTHSQWLYVQGLRSVMPSAPSSVTITCCHGCLRPQQCPSCQTCTHLWATVIKWEHSVSGAMLACSSLLSLVQVHVQCMRTHLNDMSFNNNQTRPVCLPWTIGLLGCLDDPFVSCQVKGMFCTDTLRNVVPCHLMHPLSQSRETLHYPASCNMPRLTLTPTHHAHRGVSQESTWEGESWGSGEGEDDDEEDEDMAHIHKKARSHFSGVANLRCALVAGTSG